MIELLHGRATLASLGLLRVWIFGIWLVQLAFDPIQRLAALPDNLFLPPGPLRVIPASLWSRLLEERTLLGFKIVTLTLVAFVMVGAFRRPAVPVATAVLLVIYQGIVRGYSGHMNHAELALLYATMIIAFFPISESLGVRRPLDVIEQTRSGEPLARAAFVVIALVFAISYFMVGAVRLWKGIDLFGTDTLRNNVARVWASSGPIEDGVYRVPLGTPIFETLHPLLFKAAYLGATVLELASPLMIFSRWARWLLPLSLLVFHIMNIVWLGIAFHEDMLLLVVFSAVWFHRVAVALAERDPRGRDLSPLPLTVG